MLKHKLLVAIFLGVVLQTATARSKRPRYVFVLPNGYVGWAQIIFNDPEAAALAVKDGGYLIEVPESGIARTSDLRFHDIKRQDEFYYRSSSVTGTYDLQTLPADYVLGGDAAGRDSHGGFGVMDTGGRGKGYSWFVFIGPPSIRSKVRFADSYKVAEDWRKAHGNYRVPAPDPYPSPGRMEIVEPAK